MIAFLVVTSIINLALGYALAVYLGAGGASSSREETAGDVRTSSAIAPAPLRSLEQSGQPWTQPAAASAGTLGTLPMQTESQSEPLASAMEDQERDEPQTITGGMEQELLAGIEEFRNQLAQLKSRKFDDEMPSPFAAQAVGAR